MNTTNESKPEAAKQDPSTSLTDDQKKKINSTLFFLEKAFEQVDMVKEKGHSMENFFEALAGTIGHYLQLVETGTDKARAKAIVMLNVKNALVKIAEQDNKTESND